MQKHLAMFDQFVSRPPISRKMRSARIHHVSKIITVGFSSIASAPYDILLKVRRI